MEKLRHCPICQAESFLHFKTIEDYFLSNEEFDLNKCQVCGFVFTNPRPYKEQLSRYYQSNAYLSHSKNQKNLTAYLYNLVKAYSLNKKYRIVSQYHPEGKILDIGCATGEFLHHFKKRGWITKGIEPASEPRSYAIKNFGLDVSGEHGLKSLKNKSFDVITLWHVLEHVPKLNERVEQIKLILKDDGIAVIALPNLLSWDAKYYEKFWAAYDVPRHLYHFSKKTIGLLMQQHHLKVVDSIPMKFDSFYVSLLSEKYKSGKVNYFNALKNGIKSNFYAKKNENNYSSIIYIIKKQKR